MDDELFNNIIKVYVAQMDSAMKISKILCEHSNEDHLTGDHIICGLIYRLMKPMTDNEMNESLMKADSILNDEFDSDDDDDDEYFKEVSDYKIPDYPRKIKSNHCNCKICSDVRVCLLNYHTHETNDDLSRRFKDSIQITCDKHKIFI